ncbi:MAG: hypothetical protein KDJ35_07075 [Alphaproteobacteria bacterium]|nr:hypothetical protein [Alphaproteobacteria bacterium]
MSNSKISRKRRAWTPQRRAKQAANIRKTKPWTKTCGPKTDAGKARARANATTSGMHTREMRLLRRVLRLQKAFIDGITASTSSPKHGSTKL